MEANAKTNAEKWKLVEAFFKEKFTDGERPELDTILFLIGVQELGMGNKKFGKDDKINLIHIAVCRLLEPFGYYKFLGYDDDGWPRFEFSDELPQLKNNEQSLLMRQAIIQYFEDRELI